MNKVFMTLLAVTSFCMLISLKCSQNSVKCNNIFSMINSVSFYDIQLSIHTFLQGYNSNLLTFLVRKCNNLVYANLLYSSLCARENPQEDPWLYKSNQYKFVLVTACSRMDISPHSLNMIIMYLVVIKDKLCMPPDCIVVTVDHKPKCFIVNKA